jgi:diacylglycerol kinase family enzyme
MNAVVLLNERSGVCAAGEAATVQREIREELAAAGVVAEVRCVAGADLQAEARTAAASGVDVVIAGGGDGTISSVAGALAGGKTPLGVLPMGTLNHFAKDLGIPLELAGAAKIIGDGHVSLVDVARANGQAFINNSSLGVYARALRERDATRGQWGVGKWQAMALAALKTFWRAPMVHLRLQVNGHAMALKTPLVFVGNNRYLLDLLHVGVRERLDDGLLSLYVANTSSRWGMLKILVRGLLGRLRQSRDFQTMLTSEATVETRKKRLHVAIDGELREMESPLKYEIWPQALRVFAPRPKAANDM